MIKQCCKTMMRHVDNEGGFTMIAALLMLMLLTIIGVTAINTSTTETMISSAEAVKSTAFYAAESGAEPAIIMLRKLFVEHNRNAQSFARATGGGIPPPSWSFALGGQITSGLPERLLPSAKQPTGTPPPWVKRFDAGVPWIVDANLGNGYIYNVRVWNNADTPDGSSTKPSEQNDTDGQIVVGVIATGPRNSRAAVEVVLNGVFGPGFARAPDSKKEHSGDDPSPIQDKYLTNTGTNGMRKISN